jgi:hypothetical protein
MNLGKALEALKFDNRMKDWNLKQNKVTADELKSFDQSLEDLSAKAMPLDLESERANRSSEPSANSDQNQH